MKYSASLVVRTYECDSYGHVNNAVYLNFLEYGRMEYLHQIDFDYKGLVADGYYLYITHIDIYYKASAFLDDKLFVDVEPVKLGIIQGTFHQIIRKEDGTEIGTLFEVLETGANDVYVVKREGMKNLLLPAISQCILDVQPEQGFMTVHIMEGLEDL